MFRDYRIDRIDRIGGNLHYLDWNVAFEFDADIHQLALEREVANVEGIVARVDDRGRGGGELRKILAHRHVLAHQTFRNEGPQRDRIGCLAKRNQALANFVDMGVKRLKKMLSLEEILNEREGGVVDQNRSEQFLFRFDGVRLPFRQRNVVLHLKTPVDADGLELRALVSSDNPA